MKEYAPSLEPDIVEVDGEVLPSYSGENTPYFEEEQNDDLVYVDDIYRDISDLEMKSMEIHIRHAEAISAQSEDEPSIGSAVTELSNEEYLRDLHDELPSDDNRSMWR